MTMSELISAYNGKLSKTENELDEIRAKVERNEQAAETLEARAKKKRDTAEKLRRSMNKVKSVDWKEEVIRPLAEELSKRLGRKPVYMGRMVSERRL